MSATRAANALMMLDTNIISFVASLPNSNGFDKHEAVIDFVSSNVVGTWTLSLAAQAAGVSEEQVVGALFRHASLRLGSPLVCSQEAQKLFSGLTS